MLDKANDIICHFSAELQYAVQVFLRFFSINCGLLLLISLMLFFHENEDWEDLPFFWKNLQADVLHSLLNFAAETTTNSFGSFNATQNTPYIILTKK